MPYFVYNITIHAESGAKLLKHLDTFPSYREAKQKVKEERAALPPEQLEQVRLIFAKNQVEAERLLSAPREERIFGED